MCVCVCVCVGGGGGGGGGGGQKADNNFSELINLEYYMN